VLFIIIFGALSFPISQQVYRLSANKAETYQCCPLLSHFRYMPDGRDRQLTDNFTLYELWTRENIDIIFDYDSMTKSLFQ